MKINLEWLGDMGGLAGSGFEGKVGEMGGNILGIGKMEGLEGAEGEDEEKGGNWQEGKVRGVDVLAAILPG